MGNPIWDNKNLINILKGGGVAVMPTDTVYGIVGRALDPAVVERIYRVRKRAPEKPCIILIGDVNDLDKFSINLTDAQKSKIKDYWPGPVSIILYCLDESLSYLHRGTNTLAFRLPASIDLQNLLKITGPLVAPSANLEGEPPARGIVEAKKYFGDLVDLYEDGGVLENKPSRIIQMHRDGVVDIKRL